MPHPLVAEMRRRLAHFLRLYEEARRINPSAARRVYRMWDEEVISSREADRILKKIIAWC